VITKLASSAVVVSDTI